MNTRKVELRTIVIDVILQKEKVEYPAHNLTGLKQGVCQMLWRKAGKESQFPFNNPQLSEADAVLVQEIFWDLFIEKEITLGLDASNPEPTFFRLHSEARISGTRGNS